MTKEIFRKYLINLGFTDAEFSGFLRKNYFSYSPDKTIPAIKYVLIENDEDIFKHQLRFWNRNIDNVFIAVGKEKTYIVDCKLKPQSGIIQSIESFNYGTNTIGFENINIDLISKSYIDSSYFFQFVQQKQRRKQEVDKDLLLNLIALRNDLLENRNEQVVHLIILRCLFVKYLEDRGIFKSNYLSEILANKSADRLIDAFGEVCKINGDVFGGNSLTIDDICEDYLIKLHLFFTADYQSGQGTLFPYQFDNIPIQLISHVYEAFLTNNTKKGKGVYYTPSFVVNFMLSQSLKLKVNKNPFLTVFDPAVGSAAFLVESFKIIRDAQATKLNKSVLSFDEKRQILQKQLFGVDVDSDALQISAFSLYLALLEDEPVEFIQDKIKKSHPILPSLIGNTLLHANTITDFVFEEMKFDFIVSNPPWGSVPTDDNKEHIDERAAIDNKSGSYPEYNKVADYERSQAFLSRIERWQKPDTTIVMIVKNSIFLNDKAIDFRKEFISKNKLETFYELSDYNKILFKKKTFKSPKLNIEIGASEPCAIVIFKPNVDNLEYKINYIAPKLTVLGEHFEIIQYTNNDASLVDKSEFVENDILWRILYKGSYEDYYIIQKLTTKHQNSEIVCSRGFEATQNMERIKEEPYYRTLIKSEGFDSFFLHKIEEFDWNQKLHRRRTEDLYEGEKILIAYRPTRSDKYKLRCISYSDDCVFRNDVLCFKVKGKVNYKAWLGLLNSKLFGYYIYMQSSQWDGGLKREALRTYDIKSFNFDLFDENNIELIQNTEKLLDTKDPKFISKIDNSVLNSFPLTDYEKEIINEFYQIKVARASDKLRYVQSRDIHIYFEAFKESFELVLSPNHTLNASFSISSNVGAIIKISIIEKVSAKGLEQDNTLQVLHFVKNKQLTETDKLLREEKIKLYEPTHFYLIKSNQFKDWTKRQAYKDAKEEIDLLFSNLPDTNG